MPQGGDDLQRHLLLRQLVVDRDLVEQSRSVTLVLHLDDLGSADHPLQVADAAVVAVLGLLGALVLVVLAEVAEGPGRLHLLDQLRTQDPGPVVDLLLHLFDVHFRQFVVHDTAPFQAGVAVRVRLLCRSLTGVGNPAQVKCEIAALRLFYHVR